MNPKSKKNEKKEKHEEDILNLAASNLRAIYRDYAVCKKQKDKPDKAIILSKPHPKLVRGWFKEPKVGIEITTADPQEYLAYMSDKKSDREILHAQMEEAIATRTAPQNPMKSIDNKVFHDWIYKGIKEKAKKHQNYANTGEFLELVLLCYSDVISTNTLEYKEGLKDWTDYLLGQSNFPFDRVLFVDRENLCEQIYKKSKKAKNKPTPYMYEGHIIKSSTSGMIPMGVPYNYKVALSGEPLIKPEQAVIDRRTSDSNPESTE